MEISTNPIIDGRHSFDLQSAGIMRSGLSWAKALDDDAYLNTAQAACFLSEMGARVTAGTLVVWRCRKPNGPQYVKLHSRVMYRAADLRAYVEAAKSAAA